ncbi:MAG: hypothetical protein AAGA96_11765 [Verrucomicrobiota bacterium]
MSININSNSNVSGASVNFDQSASDVSSTKKTEQSPTPLAEWPPGVPEPLKPFRTSRLNDGHLRAGVLQEDKTLLFPDGRKEPLGGMDEHPVGTVYFGDASYRLPDGVLHRSDGFTEYPDGRVEDPDGFLYAPDGRVTHVSNGEGSKTFTKDLSGLIHVHDSDPAIIDPNTNPPTVAPSQSTQLPFNASALEPDGRVRYPDGSIRDAGGGVQVGDVLTHADGRRENLTTGMVTDLEGNTNPRAEFMVSSLGGGKFSVNGREVNIENLFLHISNELSLGVQDEMQEKTESMQIKNKAVAELNEYIAKLTAERSKMEDDESRGVPTGFFQSKWSTTGSMNEDGSINWDRDQEVADFGSVPRDKTEDGKYKMNGAQMDAYIQRVKGKVEELNSNTQLEMIDLQEMVSQNNRFYDMASNIISKAGNNRQTIAGNIRA